MDLRRQAPPGAVLPAAGRRAGPHTGRHAGGRCCPGALLGKQLLRAPSSPQILKWPQPQALGQMVTKTMVNTVVANPTFTYLTALTDSNIVAIWRRREP